MRSRFSKLVATTLVGAMLALVLAACGGSDPTATPVPTPTEAPSDPGQPEPTPTPEPSFDAEAYFSGKTIRLMVGYNPGGGTDAQGRYMSSAWGKFIPGNPRIIVTNMTPNITLRNFVWNAKPDGLTISVEATPGIFDQINPIAQWDMREVSMIGVTSGKDAVWLAHESVPYTCGPDAHNGTQGDLILGTSAPTPADLGSQIAPAWYADTFNIPLTIRNLSAAGSAEQYIMIERGDTNSWYTSTVWNQLPGTRPGWVASGFIRGFMDMSFPGYKLQPNAEAEFPCPAVDEILETDEQHSQWLTITGPRTYASKNIIGPPGMDADVLQALRDSLTAAMADADFAAGLEDFANIPNNFTPGEQAQQELFDTTTKFLDNKAFFDEVQQNIFDKYVQ